MSFPGDIHPITGRGTSSSTGGTPPKTEWGTPQPGLKWGIPPGPDRDGVPLMQDWMGTPQDSIVCTCFTAGGIALSFMQEDILVHNYTLN